MTPGPAEEAHRPSAPDRLSDLDGLRGCSILAVMVYHYTVRWTPPLSGVNYYPYHSFFVGWPGLDLTWAGVEVFFVISGFVIALTLERSRGVLDFFRRRLARLWPAMLVCASLTTAAALAGPPEWRVGPLSFVLSVLFLDPGFIGGLLHLHGLGFVDGVYWTLWIEVRFYAMAALLFFAFRRRFLEALTVVTAVSFIAGLRGFDYPGRPWAWLLLLPTFLPYFAFGAGALRLRRETKIKAETAVCMGLTGLIVLVQGWASFEYPAGSILGFAAINLLLVAGFLAFARGVPVLRPFSWKPLVRLGEASYSLYLIHSVVGIVLINRLSTLMPWPAAFVLTVIMMVVVSLALFRFVERPGKKLLLTLFGAPPASLGTATATGPSRVVRSYVSPHSKG